MLSIPVPPRGRPGSIGPGHTGGLTTLPKTSGSKGARSFTLTLMRVERGLRRVTWVVTLLVGLAVAWTVFRSLLDPQVDRALAFDRPLDDYARLASVVMGIIAGTLAAAIPWVVFFLGRWLVRGFQEDR